MSDFGVPGMRSPARIAGRGPVVVLLLAALSGGLFWLVWIYGNGLRDPRYLDGWVLAAGMIVQIYFHAAVKMASLSPKSAIRWRKIHIFIGYLLIVAFVSHCNFTLPDTTLEFALWICFVLVTLSGVFGTYLAWSLRAKRGIDESIGYDRIATRRAELAREIQVAVAKSDPQAEAIGLPVTPQDAWIKDLYTAQLRDYFQGPRNSIGHLLGSQRSVKRLTDEIDNLSRFVDKQGQEKLEEIKAMVAEKERLDFASVQFALTKGWLLVHVPVTYSMIVLAVLHVIVVHAFQSGAL